MAINRKGMRKIVVDGGTYYYKMRSWHDIFETDYLVVVIEHPSGKIDTHEFEHPKYKAFTPKNVAELIKGV
jgi:hypothetical protein